MQTGVIDLKSMKIGQYTREFTRSGVRYIFSWGVGVWGCELKKLNQSGVADLDPDTDSSKHLWMGGCISEFRAWRWLHIVVRMANKWVSNHVPRIRETTRLFVSLD